MEALLGAARDEGKVEQEEELREAGLPEAIFTPGERRMLAKMQEFIDQHTLRYAKIDFLYWYEFQNICSGMLEKYHAYLSSFESNQDILRTRETQQFFVQQLNLYLAIVTANFDIMNCEKCTNISYFALSDVSTILRYLFHSFNIGYLRSVYETIWAESAWLGSCDYESL